MQICCLFFWRLLRLIARLTSQLNAKKPHESKIYFCIHVVLWHQ
jgi:hypothetical protein